MQEKDVAPGSTEPSLDELHRMFEEKDRVREEERKRLSRLATMILLAIPLVLGLLFLCVPDKRKPSGPAPESEVMAKAAEIQRQLGAGGEPGVGAGATEADERRGDLRFALDLLRYVTPENAGSKPAEATPVAPEDKR